MTERTQPQERAPFWSRRERIRAVLVGVAALVIVGVPVARFDDPKPARFGWHMFSAEGSPPTYSVTTDDGEVIEINRRAYAPIQRLDLRMHERLPSHLCDQIENAAEIAVITEAATDTHSCS